MTKKSKYPFFEKTEEGSIIFRGYYMEVLVSEEHKENDMFIMSGSNYSLLGLVTFRVKMTESSSFKTYTLTLPSTITTSPTSSKVESMVLSGSDEPENVTVLQYYKDDKFIHNVNITESSADASNFIFLFHGGKIPNSVPYNELYTLYSGALNIHGVGVGAPSSIMEVIISGICRTKGDMSTPFRVQVGKDPKVDQHDYVTINMKRLPMLTSTFSAISFEDINNSINASIVKTQYNMKDVESPIEKSIKY